MEILHYPTLCWEITTDAVCGVVVGTSYELVASNVFKLKEALGKQLTKDVESDDHDVKPKISKPVLKMVSVEVRPEYQEKDGIYPNAVGVKIPVAAVYGENEHGFYQCFLPLLGEEFYFYDIEQSILLIEHFSKNKLKGLSPENLHQYLLLAAPWLEDITVKFQEDARKIRAEGDWQPDKSHLARIAELFPYPKHVKQKIKVFPEAAWEQGESVQLVVDKILKEEANLLLVGPDGVGKSAILREAMLQVHHLTRAQEHRRSCWKTSPHRLVAGARYLGEWQQQCESLMTELDRSHGILWLTDFIDLFRLGGEGPEDSLAAFMLPDLRTGKLQLVSEVTPQELEAAQRLLPGFVEHFQTVHIPEMEESKVLKVLDCFRAYVEEKLAIQCDKATLPLCYRLLKRFIKYESFPGKAIRFLSNVVNEAYLKKRPRMETNDIIAGFTDKTGMPELFLRDDLLLDKDELRAYFTRRIIGQDAAVEQICSVVKIFKAGLHNPNKPVATMLFAGPTGVGKTASARALADYFFGTGQKLNPLIRLDMSEFQHPFQVEKLIGSGSGEPGKLVKEVRERPFSVVLLDEIEKAHSSIFDALLTMLDEGLLVDAYGRVCDFRNTIIIMTSNLGARKSGSLGFVTRDVPDFQHAITSFFRPEFYNRLDMVVIFHALGPETIHQITLKELRELEEREGLAGRHIRLDFSTELVCFLSRAGFDEKYGARPLQRAIERLVVASLAQFLLAHRPLRNCLLHLDWRSGEVCIEIRNFQ